MARPGSLDKDDVAVAKDVLMDALSSIQGPGSSVKLDIDVNDSGHSIVFSGWICPSVRPSEREAKEAEMEIDIENLDLEQLERRLAQVNRAIDRERARLVKKGMAVKRSRRRVGR